jgi:TRAP-type C4-dicarboxylate transport system permease small subunit
MEKKYFIYKFHNNLLRFEEILVVVLLSALILIICADVLLRYFKYPLYGSSELVRYIFVWLIMFSAAICIDRRKHFMIDLIIKKFKLENQRKFILLGDILIFLFLILLIYKGIILSIKIGDATSPSLGIPQYFPYLAIPIGGFFMLLSLVLEFIQKKNI